MPANLASTSRSSFWTPLAVKTSRPLSLHCPRRLGSTVLTVVLALQTTTPSDESCWQCAALRAGGTVKPLKCTWHTPRVRDVDGGRILTKHHREQFPFHVALQRVQAPCDVIVIWPKKGRSFRSLRIEEGTLDDTLRSFQGGGGPSTELRADQAITIFVTDPNTQISGIGAPENTAYLRVGRRSHGLVYINWSDPDRPQPESSLCVIWSSLARERGAPPVMFVGTEADAMYRHAHGRTSGLPSAALGSGRAVRSITRRQVRERLRLESEARKKVSKVTVTSIRVSGLRGFSTEARLGAESTKS